MVAVAISTTAKEVELVPADPHAASALQREKFLPVTRSALMDRLTIPSTWPNGDVVQVRRFMRYLLPVKAGNHAESANASCSEPD